MLPGLDGHVICRRLARQWPGTTTVLMVGQYQAAEVWEQMHLQAHCLLGKPFPPEGIDAQIRAVVALARERQGAWSGRSREEPAASGSCGPFGPGLNEWDLGVRL